MDFEEEELSGDEVDDVNEKEIHRLLGLDKN